MRLTRSITDATESVTSASVALSETVPDIRRAAESARESFTVIALVAIAGLMLATVALILAGGNRA